MGVVWSVTETPSAWNLLLAERKLTLPKPRLEYTQARKEGFHWFHWLGIPLGPVLRMDVPITRVIYGGKYAIRFKSLQWLLYSGFGIAGW